jgi:pilus assembly protein CpaF
MSQLPASQKPFPTWQQNCGPLAPFLEDPTITEIMVNGAGKIFIEQKGIIKRTGAKFENDQVVVALMMAMATALGKKLDAEHPMIDGRLPDGSRINCVLPPVAVDGPSLTIRKFSNQVLNYQQLVAAGVLDDRMAYFLSCCVQAKMNIIVSGGTGSGKTTLLNVLSSFIPLHERIVSIEDTAELKLRNENLVRLEARSPSEDDSGVSIRALVGNALRMRPDRIIVGECRGPEALDMLTAMNTGHEGSMTTVHANAARDALRRIETMVLMSGIDLPLRVIRQNISGTLNVIVQVQRSSDGTRRVVEIIEVGGMEGDVILSQEIFRWLPGTGFRSMGFVPGFIRFFKERGIEFPVDFFTDQYTVKTNTSRKQK